MKKSILLDVDEVVCFPGFLNAANDFLGTDYKIDDFSDYYLDSVAIPKERMGEFIKFINNRNLYDDAVLLPDAFEVIKKLNDVYDIYILSSCINPFDIEGSGRLFKDKYDFLVRELPFLDVKKFIFSATKNIIKADIQIDDRLHNLDNDIPVKILFSSYHNMEDVFDDKIVRAGTHWSNAWKDIEKMLLG